MNLTEEIIIKALSGETYFIKDVCGIRCLTLKEIARIGFDKFYQMLQVMLIEKPLSFKEEKFNQIFKGLSNFQFFLALFSGDEEFRKSYKEAFKFFLKENILLLEKSEKIIVGPISENRIIDESCFNEIQHVLKRFYFLDIDEEEIVINENDSERVKQLKMKMSENRKKVAAAKRADKNKNKSNLEMSDLIASVAIGINGLNIINIWDMTYYAFYDQLRRMNWHESFDINNRAAMAGAKLKESQMQHWMKPIAVSE